MTLVIALALVPFSILTFIFAGEILVGIPSSRRRDPRTVVVGCVVIVIPAHNEAGTLGARLPAVISAAAGRARILLVADNCTDSTAEIAMGLGVEVIERLDPERQGKGYALDFARLHLAANPPDIVVVLDADCAIDRDAVDKLVGDCKITGRPCQATYLLSPVTDGHPTVQLSTFAFYIRNAVRQRGLQRMTGRVHLVGTGMAFPWSLFHRSSLGTDNIVEDLELGLELAEEGHSPRLVEDALVWSDAAGRKETFRQRQRWEGGYLSSAFVWGPRMLGRNIRRGDLRGLWAASNLFVPPFALLLLLDFGLLALAAGVTQLGYGREWPLLLLGTSMLFALLGILLAWAAGGSRFVGPRALARAPFYLFWKIPLYLGLVREGAPKEWLRTDRGLD